MSFASFVFPSFQPSIFENCSKFPFSINFSHIWSLNCIESKYFFFFHSFHLIFLYWCIFKKFHGSDLHKGIKKFVMPEKKSTWIEVRKSNFLISSWNSLFKILNFRNRFSEVNFYGQRAEFYWTCEIFL